jgi:hypothetical protein
MYTGSGPSGFGFFLHSSPDLGSLPPMGIFSTIVVQIIIWSGIGIPEKKNSYSLMRACCLPTEKFLCLMGQIWRSLRYASHSMVLSKELRIGTVCDCSWVIVSIAKDIGFRWKLKRTNFLGKIWDFGRSLGLGSVKEVGPRKSEVFVLAKACHAG